MPVSRQPIDRGWAWMCVLGSHVIMFFLIGGFKTLGILFVEFREAFDATSASTAIMLGLIPGFMSLLSPLSTAFGEYYTNRLVVTVGGCFVALATFLTSFAVDMKFVICSFGILSGIGYGLIFGPSLVVVGQFFKKRRSFANGVAVAGGSMGQLIIPLLLRKLIDTYLWRGALLIYSGLVLHIIAAGLLFRPLSFWDRHSKSEKRPEVQQETIHREAGGKLTNKALMQLRSSDTKSKVQSTPDLCSGVMVEKDIQASHLSLNIHHGVKRLQTPSLQQASSGHLALRYSQPLSLSTGSLYFQPMQDMVETPAPKNTPGRVPFWRLLKASFCCCSAASKDVPSLFDWSLFKNYMFVMYVLAIACGNTGYVNLFLILPPFGEDLGLSKHNVALLISIAGVCDLVCRIAGGYFADLGYMRRTNIMAWSIMITGIATIVCPIYPLWPVMITYVIVVGVMGGFYISLFLVVLMDIVGLERTPKGFGLTIMIMGIINLVSPALLGYMRDSTGSWYAAFLFCGICMLVCSICFFCEPLVHRLQTHHDNKVHKAGQHEADHSMLGEGHMGGNNTD